MIRREARDAFGAPTCRVPQIVGVSRPMRDVLDLVARVAGTRSTVFPASNSRASRHPFLRISCSANAREFVARPRIRRDLTVPRLTARISAISS